MQSKYAVGDKVYMPRLLDSNTKKLNKATASWGRVIFVHPENRFITVQFKYSRECYTPSEIDVWNQSM